MIDKKLIAVVSLLSLAAVIGCEREPSPSAAVAAAPTNPPSAVVEQPAASPVANEVKEVVAPAKGKTAMELMQDEDFRREMDAANSDRRKLMKIRLAIVDRMQAKIDAAQERLGTTDEAVLKVELEKDPEWNSLYRRCEDVNQALSERRHQFVAEMSRRMNPKRVAKKQKISK